MVLLQASGHSPYTPAYTRPNLVIFFGKTLYDPSNNHINSAAWVDSIPASAAVIMLYEHVSGVTLHQLGNSAEQHLLWNYIVIAINEDLVHTFDFVPLRIVRHFGVPRPEDLLRDRLKTSAVLYVSAGYIESHHNLYNQFLQVEFMLQALFYERIGVQLKFRKTIDGGMKSVEQVFESYVIINSFYFLHYEEHLVDSIEFQKTGIFVPRGTKLSSGEVFLKPFSLAVWILLGIICCLSYVLHQFARNWFKNNLFLLALVGWEKRKLRLTNRWEKMLATVLLILFFQLKCAYETKIISYLIDWPLEPDPTSIQELREKNIQVLFNSKYTEVGEFENKLEDLIVDMNGGNFDPTGKAVVTAIVSPEQALVMDFNLDVGTGKLRYTLLPEVVKEHMNFFIFRTRSPFQRKFARYQRAAFEAGLIQYWKRTVIGRHQKKERLRQIAAGRFDQRIIPNDTEQTSILQNGFEAQRM
ncbi:uncharacterized protein LOC118460805 [Anopheles albimanus]|uniref:uncharacterized protein LOC118460805 n=1 Tax=Anopheles albimanus TaxID=7167 RepID=UPI001640E768|nr:uncharacterized protein LOC118460805 [Anopheles albimanus]